jgi:DnaJ-class molecular chaperone
MFFTCRSKPQNMTWGVAQHRVRNRNACLNENGNMLFDLRCGHIFSLQQCHECYGGGYNQCKTCGGRGWVSMYNVIHAPLQLYS